MDFVSIPYIPSPTTQWCYFTQISRRRRHATANTNGSTKPYHHKWAIRWHECRNHYIWKTQLDINKFSCSVDFMSLPHSPEKTELIAKQLISVFLRPFLLANAEKNSEPQPIPSSVILLTQFFSSSKIQYSTSTDGKI